MEGDIETVKTMLETAVGAARKVLVSSSDNANDQTPLHVAIEHGRTEVTTLLVFCLLTSSQIAKLLIDNGAPLNAQDKIGRSPLLYACRRGNLEICQIMIEKGKKTDVIMFNILCKEPM